ncbi:hypothetical protein Q7M01_00775 [Candidatus Liberibacter asiaticus]
MKNEKEFLDKRDASFRIGQFPSSIPSLDSSIKDYSRQLTNIFLKDKVFFDGLEQELLASLGSMGQEKFVSYARKKRSQRSPEDQLPSSKHLSPRFGSAHENFFDCDLENKPFPVETVVEKKENVDKSLQSKPSTDLLVQATSFLKESVIDYPDCDSEIMRGLDDDLDRCFEKKDRTSAIQLDKTEEILKGELTDKTDSSFSDSMAKYGTGMSSALEGKKENIFLADDQGISLKSKEDMLTLDIQSLEKSPVDDCGISLTESPKKRLGSHSAIDDDLGLDFGDIEKELLSISGCANRESDSRDQEKKSSDIEKSESQGPVFDLKKIVRFEEYPKDMDELVISSLLVDEEKLSLEKVNHSLEQDIATLSFEEGGKKYLFNSNTEGIARGISINRDCSLGDDVHRENMFSAPEISVDGFHEGSSLVSPALKSNSKRDVAQNRKFWLIGYILIVVGCGIYWFFQLHREISFANEKPLIVNAIKDPMKVIPSSSEEENDTSFNQVHEVYDRFSGEKPSSPKLNTLFNLQEKPIDFRGQNQETSHYKSPSIIENSIRDIQAVSQVSVAENEDRSRSESIIVEKEIPQLSQQSSFLMDNKENFQGVDSLQINLSKLKGNIPVPRSYSNRS